MLHICKKKISFAQGAIRGAPNAEFLTLKTQLANIKNSLRYTSNMLETTERGWIKQIQAQRNFSDRYFESYPSPGDEVHTVAAQFAAGSEHMYDEFLREQSPDVLAYQSIHQQVKNYIAEIEAVEASYKPMIEARCEADRYQSKIDYLERSKKQNKDAKKLRNLQKMDREKENYKELLVGVVAAQKRTYAKHPVVFKAALVSYWLSHSKHVKMLLQSLEHTQAFAEKYAEEMLKLDISKLEPEFLNGAMLATPKGVLWADQSPASKVSSEKSTPAGKQENDIFQDALASQSKSVPAVQPLAELQAI